MMTTQIGAQMYTLRDDCKTPADIARTCKKLSNIGFGAVQASGLCPIDAKDLRKILDDHGLVCAATHTSIEEMQDTEAILDYHAALDCKLTAIGGFGWGDPTQEEWKTFAHDYSQIAKTLSDRGLRIGYHNHAHEFVPFNIVDDPAGISLRHTPWQLLQDDLEASVWFEIDTYWIQEGGSDPAMWIDSLPGRVPAIHVKDMTMDKDAKHVMCEVGAGNLNWTAILTAAQRADVQWYLIERDDGMLDPFESLKISRENLLAMGLK